jgi:hypothetical protein
LGDGGGEDFGELETGYGAVETYDHKDAVSRWETIKVPKVEGCFLQDSHSHNPIFSLHLANFPGLLARAGKTRARATIKTKSNNNNAMEWNPRLLTARLMIGRPFFLPCYTTE